MVESMKLAEVWQRSPEFLTGRLVQQVIGLAGKGKLGDDNDCSHEFRAFLEIVPSDSLTAYAEQCLASTFDGNGEALQDIVNEIGRRLGFDVANGRYRGSVNHIGHDGLWRSPTGHAVIVESKTTDTYRIDLKSLANYRKRLADAGEVDEDDSSVLIVVGRQETEGLEEQIRGSRHAWDIRVITVSALCRLMHVKESLEDPDSVQKVRDILIPREFTRLDAIVDLVFSTAQDIESPEAADDGDVDGGSRRLSPVNFHRACISRVERHLGRTLPKRSRSTFSSSDGALVVICAVSKEHEQGGNAAYWFAALPPEKLTILCGNRLG
jgi:hypothetical protein